MNDLELITLLEKLENSSDESLKTFAKITQNSELSSFALNIQGKRVSKSLQETMQKSSARLQEKLKKEIK
jgi:hypothetical protein